MKRILIIFLLFNGFFFAQTKQELNLEINMLKEQVKTLESSNQALLVKTTSLEKDVEYLQKQIDELKLAVSSQAQRNASQEYTNGSVPTPANPQIAPAPQPRPQTTPTSTVGQYGRCRATTQKGTQCSRNAKSNGYCYQHGGAK